MAAADEGPSPQPSRASATRWWRLRPHGTRCRPLSFCRRSGFSPRLPR